MSCSRVYDIAITSDNRVVISGNYELLFYDDRGNKVADRTASSLKDTTIQSLTVDSKGRIIVGLGNSQISIHCADGQFISQFTTRFKPIWLAATWKGEIVATCDDGQTQIMNDSGENVRVLQPPKDAKDWQPTGVCCSNLGEVFVVNHGNPKAVYRYRDDGEKCLGCIITGLNDPFGIAVKKDGQQLFVTECYQNVVKIYQVQ